MTIAEGIGGKHSGPDLHEAWTGNRFGCSMNLEAGVPNDMREELAGRKAGGEALTRESGRQTPGLCAMWDYACRPRRSRMTSSSYCEPDKRLLVHRGRYSRGTA